ncbi:MAG: GNAT family N-acetyltransferase [Alphaproteobacteria bacterium]|nr:GNAT family N-acetyltransferase [Alphaproteobacteria bacterium]
MSAAVRPAAAADSQAIAASLARAFHDDPVMMFMLPDAAAREAKLPRIFRLLLKMALPHGLCRVSEGYETATIWKPPGQWHLSPWDYVVNGPEMLGIFGGNVFSVIGTMDRIEKVHPKTPHYYLQVIGTDPPAQGKGFASAIMRDQLARSDAEGMSCYLESSKDTNIPVYRSFGFEVTGEIKIPDGPTLWPMWRDAR